MNAVILVSVLSVANSSFFGSSRVLAALAEQRQAPKILRYVDRSGRPLVAVGIGLAFGLIGYVGAEEGGLVIDWLMALSGMSSLYTWASICFAHIRFRKAWALQGHELSELVYESPVGSIGSWLGLAGVFGIVATQFYVAIDLGPGDFTTSERVVTFFQAVLAVPVVAVFFVGFKLCFRTKWVSVNEIDVNTGRFRMKTRQSSLDKSGWSLWKKLSHALF